MIEKRCLWYTVASMLACYRVYICLAMIFGILFSLTAKAEIFREEYCRSSEFILKAVDEVLHGHVMDTRYVSGISDCLQNCNSEGSCKSVNYEEVSNAGLQLRVCELNDANEESTNYGYLVSRPGFAYYELSDAQNVVDCLSSPCLNGGTCIAGKGDCGSEKSFCQCDHGFKGIFCAERFYAKTCKEIKENYPGSTDGEYELYLKWPECHQPARIYCSSMNKTSPLEYITLPAGKDKNFAVHYNGITHQREETQFEKIRLLVPEIAVKGDDYTFAVSNVGNIFHSYASGYDCVSASCNGAVRKGQFQVDLSGTSFRLPTSIPYQFHSYPHCVNQLFYPSMSADRLRWSAKCGGSCGHCLPKAILLEIPEC